MKHIYKIEYSGWPARTVVFKTEVAASSRDEAIAWFNKYYQAEVKSCRKTRKVAP